MHPFVMVHGQEVSAYTLMTLASFVAAAAYFWFAARRVGVPRGNLAWFVVCMLFVQDVGGAILPTLERVVSGRGLPGFPYLAGRYFYSTLGAAVLFTLWWIRRFKWPRAAALDRFMAAAMLMSAVGRLGCFLEGCCGGKYCDLPWPWGLQYPADPPGDVRHPVQLYAFAAELGIFVVLVGHMRWREKTAARRPVTARPPQSAEAIPQRTDSRSTGHKPQQTLPRSADTLWLGVILYSVYRFLIEFLRTNKPVFLEMPYGQLFSVVTFIIGIYALIRNQSRSSAG